MRRSVVLQVSVTFLNPRSPSSLPILFARPLLVKRGASTCLDGLLYEKDVSGNLRTKMAWWTADVQLMLESAMIEHCPEAEVVALHSTCRYRPCLKNRRRWYSRGPGAVCCDGEGQWGN